MKQLTILVLLAGLVLGVIALRASDPIPVEARDVPRALSEPPAKGNVVRAFEVEGMCCLSCPESLREAVSELDGVAAIAVDPTSGRVEVEVSAALDAATLTSALTFGDYSAHPLD